MNIDLARQLLAAVAHWDAEELAEFGNEFQWLASVKYDQYEGYRPGERFLECLVGWLHQMDDLRERRLAARFVLKDLVFVSHAELDHLIDMAYPDVLRQMIRSRVAEESGMNDWQVTRVTGLARFNALQRKTLIVGLSDGARLDRLRRASPQLSQEQFYLVPEVGAETQASMREKLADALIVMNCNDPAQFEQVVLVEDFAGSGYTLLHRDDSGWGGKLWRASSYLETLRKDELLVEGAQVHIIVYVITEAAKDHLLSTLQESGLGWGLSHLQLIPAAQNVSDPEIHELAKKYFDPILADKHMAKGGPNPHLGFGGQGLPLVLHHNAPNNSVALLWADTRGRAGSQNRRGLFPRRLRHNPETP